MTKQNLKERGRILLQQNCFLGDTSGRTKQENEKSVFAIASKNTEFSVKFLSKEKEKVIIKLKRKHKKYGEERIKTIMHAVNIYFAVKGFIEIAPKFYICCDGFNKRLLTQEVKSLLENKYEPKKFSFEDSLKQMFGKHNIADKLDGKVRKGNKKPNILITEKSFKKLKLI